MINKKLTKEELDKRNAAIREGRKKDMQYYIYLGAATKRMQAPKSRKTQHLSHSAYIQRIGG